MEEFAISKVSQRIFQRKIRVPLDEILESDDNELGPLSDLPPDAEVDFFEDDSGADIISQHPFRTLVPSQKRMMAFRYQR